MNSNKIKYNVFFDESEVKDLQLDMEISLAGCLRAPQSLYSSTEIKSLTDELRRGSMKLHFSEYRKHDLKKYSQALKRFFGENGKNIKYLKFNLIAYTKDEYIRNHTAYSPANMRKMEYAKIPERVIYGSIRNISKYKPTEARLYIENSTEYSKIKLHKLLKEQLNVQSLYRNDNFTIETSLLYPKGKEIGIEMTDLILGIISVVMRNGESVDNTGEIISKRLFDKKKFIYSNKLIIDPILKNVFYFEMNGVDRLTKREFIPFWNEFIIQFEQELMRKK